MKVCIDVSSSMYIVFCTCVLRVRGPIYRFLKLRPLCLLKILLFFLEFQKQLEQQYEQEFEDVKKAFESDSMLQPFSFSRKAIDVADICKEAAEHKVKLATQTYEKVRNS